MPEKKDSTSPKKEKGESKSSNNNWIKLTILVLIIGFLYAFFSSFFGIFEKRICGDETPYGECSKTQPYFCMSGKLVQDASFCGCSNNSEQKGDFCKYRYQNDSNASYKIVELNYFLNGKKHEFDFIVYKDMKEYLDKKPKSIVSYAGEDLPSLKDFKIKNMDDEEQKNLLMPLVIEIQNLAQSKEDQARIALSLVQNIPYEDSVLNARGLNLDLKYPYEVLYDNEGLCGSKSELLAFLLKEIGYDVVIFHYYFENHEAVGIRCPMEYSLNGTGYCFVESTQPAILSYSNGYYSEQGRLVSTPEIISISEGISLGNNLEEYKDAKDFDVLSQNAEKHNGARSIMESLKYSKLSAKYGITY